MAKNKTDTERPSDQEGQQGVNIEKMTEAHNRDHPPAPVPGSKDDHETTHPERLHGPLHDEGERSGTRTDQ